MDISEINSEIEGIRKQEYDEYITVKGVRIRYSVHGSGSPVVLLHGFGGLLETWAFNIPPLSRRYRVYAIDLPGHGLSGNSESCYKPAYISDYTAAIMDDLGIKRASFIGHSLGGLVSLNIALKLPDRVSRLILIDSAGLSRKMPWVYRIGSVPVLGEVFMKVAAGPAFERSMKKIFRDSDALSEDMLDMFLGDYHRTRAADSLLCILRHNVGLKGPRSDNVMIERLPQIKAPTMFVHGGRDTIFPLSQVQEAFKMVPDSRVRIFNECGHCPHIERVVEFNELAMSFLEAG